MVTHPTMGLAKARFAARTAAASSGRLRAGLMGCVALACVAGLTAPLNSAAAQVGQCLQTPSLNQRPDRPPPDVCSQAEIGDRDFYAFAWQLFKFLIWPAASEHRGKSDVSRAITDMQGPRVFETFKPDWEIFRPNAEQPVWSDYPPKPCEKQPGVRPDDLVLASFSKFGPIAAGGPAKRHILVARNRTYVRYRAGYNEVLFDSIVRNRLYDTRRVSDLRPATLHGPIDPRATSPEGAMTVKSAWVELSGPDGNIAQSRFYSRDAWVEDPDNKCRLAKVGLVGLHVVYKTNSRPQWIWSTFEHVDNAPERGVQERAEALSNGYTFNNGRSMPMPPEAPGEFQIPRPTREPWPDVPPKPFQVERLQRIATQVLDVNQEWQGELARTGSVWKNYKLVMSQWPLLPRSPDVGIGEDAMSAMPGCSATSTTPATANTTMETFQQRCELRLTCMGCHNRARTTDFIWAIALNPHGFGGPPPPREEAIKQLEEILGKGK